MRLLKRIFWIIVALLIVAAIGWSFVPRPVEVDVAEVQRGPMRVTVDQDGKTRVKERYVIATPLMGRLIRIGLKAGDPVEAGKTVLASIVPTPPQFLDARARDEAEARVRMSEAALRQAEPAIERAVAQRGQAKLDLERAQRLSQSQAVSQEELEEKTLAVSVREADVKAATFARDVAKFQLEQARAALARTASDAATTSPSAAGDAVFNIVSPISGRVLRVMQESEMPMPAGTTMIEVGDVRDIEAVIDVLSRDAVAIRPGALVLLERWGGGEPLRGRVRVIEPSGFTKISALGVEEQRVNVIVDFVDPLESREGLGDGYRVDARIITWEKSDVLKVPVGALSHTGDEWTVFALSNGRAVRRTLKLGHTNDLEAEVLAGLTDTDRVIIHPSDKIKDGVAIKERPH